MKKRNFDKVSVPLWRFVAHHYPFEVTRIVLVTLLSLVSRTMSLALLLPLIESLSQKGQLEGSHVISKCFVRIMDFLRLEPNFFNIFILGLSLILFQALLEYIQNCEVAKVSTQLAKRNRQDLYEAMVAAQLDFFQHQKMGVYINGIIQEARRGSSAFIQLSNMVVAAFFLLSNLIVAFWISWKLSLIIFPFVLTLVWLSRRREFIRRAGALFTEANAGLQSLAVEFFTGIREVKLLQLEGYSAARFGEATNEVSEKYYYLQKIQAKVKLLYEIVAAAILLIIMGLTFFVLNLPAAFLVAYLTVLIRIAPAFTQVQSNRDKFIGTIPSYDRVQEFLREAGEKVETTEGEDLLESSFRHEIFFDDVTFTYSSMKTPAVKGVSFVIPKGKTVAIVGPSGSGKSTIIHLLVRFYEPQYGRILLDGKRLDAYKLHQWRRRIGIVSQNTFLFNDSILENIRYGYLEATRSDVVAAAKKAHAHEFIEAMPQGYDTLIGDRGMKLSGGQRQRIAFARTILKDPEILILDEATSELDSKSERALQESLDEMRKQRTVLIIAHRLSTIERADLIFVLKDSRLVEQGSHQDLMREAPIYKELYSLQFRG